MPQANEGLAHAPGRDRPLWTPFPRPGFAATRVSPYLVAIYHEDGGVDGEIVGRYSDRYGDTQIAHAFYSEEDCQRWIDRNSLGECMEARPYWMVTADATNYDKILAASGFGEEE